MNSFARTVAVLLSVVLVFSAFASEDPPASKETGNKPATEQKAKKKKRMKKRDTKKEVLPEPTTPTPAPKTETKPDPKPETQKPEPKQAATNESQAGEDFAFQGEYMGPVSHDPLDSSRAGLQVMALGNGSFEANLLRGGLPGAGWDRRMKEKLSGELKDGKLVLKNEHWKVLVEPHRATLQQPEGQPWGVIPKYHRISSTQDATPWAGATVLFDGTNTSHFQKATRTDDGLLSVGAVTKQPVRDFHMHLEFRTPFMPSARGQGRGNSGIYIQERYEVQILDSFGLDGANNECGGLYKQRAPAMNMCLPPLSWQTYDITFTAARFDAGGKKVADARITVLHNGEPIHWQYALTDKTGGGKAEGPAARPILFQDHGNPVTFRNIWITNYSAGPPQAPREIQVRADAEANTTSE
jgi:hypothetical protein